MADITIIGAEAIVTGLGYRLVQMQAEIDKAIQGAGLMCEAEAKANCPVDTGRLKSSITYQNDGPMACSVGTNVSYGQYVEFGTYKMAAQPYLFPAFQKAVVALQDALKQL